jgi:hypothetical protein
VRNKIVLSGLLLLFVSVAKAQTLVFGGFASFAITDSVNANSGGAIVAQDSRTRCLMVQGGHVFGQAEMYNVSSTFREICNDAPRATDIRVYPNPGFGNYWVEGKNIEKIEVFDNVGRMISSTEVKINGENLWKTPIILTNQPEGNYFVKIRDTSGEQWVYSLIKLKP